MFIYAECQSTPCTPSELFFNNFFEDKVMGICITLVVYFEYFLLKRSCNFYDSAWRKKVKQILNKEREYFENNK